MSNFKEFLHRKQLHKRWYVWAIIVIIIIAIFGQLNGKDDAATTTSTSTNNSGTTETWATADLTVNNVTAALRGKHWNRSITDFTKITVTDGNVNIYFDLKPDYGVADELMQASNTMVVVSQILFANPAVKSVGVWGDTTFVDPKGNQSDDVGVKLIWDRDSYTGISWDNYRDMVLVDYKKPFQIAYAYSIHPALYADLKDKTDLPVMK